MNKLKAIVGGSWIDIKAAPKVFVIGFALGFIAGMVV